MKRLWAVAILALALPAFGQIRGVPASVTSFGQDRGNTPGVPASVTSLGPRGFSNHNSNGARFTQSFHLPAPNGNTICSTPGPLIPSAMGCTGMGFTNQFYGLPVNAPATNSRGRGGNHGRPANYYPVYVPYTVPVMVDEEAPQTDTRAVVDEDADEPPAMTVFERRPKIAAPMVSASPINESRVYHPAPNQAAPVPAEERLAPALVLIYKDGHQREVQNYAIMGSYIYDIGTFVAQKIPLADLNLKATLKANDERGVDFALPASVTP